MCASVVHAKDVTGVMLVTPTVPLNSNAALQINFTHTDSSLCGVAIDWGNGNQQEIRLGYEKFKDSPVTLNQTYASPGTYFIKLEGRYLSRGLFSAVPCNVLAKPVSIRVTDPVAEKLAADQRAAEAALRQSAVREREAAERERAALVNAEKAKQELLTQKAAALEMEMEFKRKELEIREAQLRKDEEARRAAPKPAARPAAPAASTSPAPAASSGGRPPVKSADGF